MNSQGMSSQGMNTSNAVQITFTEVEWTIIALQLAMGGNTYLLLAADHILTCLEHGVTTISFALLDAVLLASYFAALNDRSNEYSN